jgi:hypothetical protein
MIQRMWPGGVQPETARPYIIPRRLLGDLTRNSSLAVKPRFSVMFVNFFSPGSFRTPR